jgi:hypothetical protein
MTGSVNVGNDIYCHLLPSAGLCTYAGNTEDMQLPGRHRRDALPPHPLAALEEGTITRDASTSNVHISNQVASKRIMQ